MMVVGVKEGMCLLSFCPLGDGGGSSERGGMAPYLLRLVSEFFKYMCHLSIYYYLLVSTGVYSVAGPMPWVPCLGKDFQMGKKASWLDTSLLSAASVPGSNLLCWY